MMKPVARTEPLAPPAAINNASSRTFPRVAPHQRKSVPWIPWLSLSPRIRRRPGADKDGDQSEWREKAKVRRASFDHERSTSRTDDGYSKKSSIEDSLIMASGSIFDSSSHGPRSRSASQPRNLLTIFLVHLDNLLPEYSRHLASVPDPKAASSAVSVLERGAETLYLSFGEQEIVNRSVDISSATITATASSSVPNSPVLPLSQNTRQVTPTADQFQSKHRKSPTSAPSPVRSVRNATKRFSASIYESEWERFVSPLLTLVGAECLYTNMTHVRNPRLFSDEHDKEVKFSPKRDDDLGVRRLLSMYKRVRQDLVIVGEYLCDPVLGSPKRKERFPLPPLLDDTSLSPEKCAGSPRSSYGQDNSNEKRELAAVSLRRTLDAFICLIDLRSTMIKIHGELCDCTSGGKATTDKALPKHEWSRMSRECVFGGDQLTVHAKSIAKGSIVLAQLDAKALGEVLQSIQTLVYRNYFSCVTLTRKVYIQIKNAPPDYLPIAYVRLLLRGVLSLMHVYFANRSGHGSCTDTRSSMTRTDSGGSKASRISFTLTSQPSIHVPKPPTAIGNAKELLKDFVLQHRNGVSLSMGVVTRKATSTNASTGDSKSRWLPLSVSSNTSGGATDELHSVGKQFRNNNWLETGSNMVWPFTLWRSIEDIIDEHLLASILEPKQYDIEYKSSRGNDIKIQHTNRQTPVRRVSIYVAIVEDSPIVIFAVQECEVFDQRKRADSAEVLGALEDAARLASPNFIFRTEVVRAIYETETTANLGEASTTSSTFWNENKWSETQQKNVLHSLGLRQKNSPLMPPLKSPYIKHKTFQRRRRRSKTSLNHGHFDFFLGQELSACL